MHRSNTISTSSATQRGRGRGAVIRAAAALDAGADTTSPNRMRRGLSISPLSGTAAEANTVVEASTVVAASTVVEESTVADAGVANVAVSVGVVVAAASGGAATAVVHQEVRARASSMPAEASTASRATVRAADGGDVNVVNVVVAIVAIVVIVVTVATVVNVANVVNVVREDVENIGAAAGGAREARGVSGEDVVMGIEAGNTAAVVKDVVKDVEVAVRPFRKVRDTC